MKNEKKMNNKGFSLVELIIVIAIMAVLIAVLAPQYMRFIERGRAASDRDNVKAVQGALEVYYVDPTDSSKLLTTGTVVTLKRGDTATCTGATDAVNEALKTAGLIQSGQTFANLPKLTNTETFEEVTITVTIDPTDHTCNIVVAGTGY